MQPVARIRQAVRGAGFGALTLACGTGVLVHVALAGSATAKAEARDFWSGSWSRALLRLFHVGVRVHGDPRQPGMGNARGRVVAANHRSIIDIALMLSRFGGAVLSRAEVARWPLIGYGARSAGTIFVDRKDKRSGAHAIDAMAERLALGDTICVFPEGTTFVDDEVRRFKLGAFVAAVRAGAAVVPVGLVYPEGSGAAYGGETFLTHLARLAGSRGTVVHVEIGMELTLGEHESVEDFAERGRIAVEALVARGRARRDDLSYPSGPSRS